MSLFIAIAAILAVLAVVLVAMPLVRPRPDEQGSPVGASQAAAIAVVVAVPVLAFILYFTLSDWPWDEQAQLQQAAGGHAGGGSLNQVAEQLEQRLARGQGDLEGWMMLGRTYVVMGDYEKALRAYTQAYTLTSGQDVEAMLGYAEARVLVDERDFDGEAGQIFERAVAMAPDNGKALWYAGVTAYRQQDLETARQRWSALREIGGPPEIMEILNARIAEIDASLGGTPEAVALATPPPASPPSAMTAAVAPAAAATGDPVVAGDGIALRIVVAPELAGRVPGAAPLFVLARGAAGGPPLAAMRRSSAELPLDVTLTDANAMIPGTSLTQVDDLQLVARVSLTGRPVASSGDLYGEVRYDPASTGRITLTIDRVVD